jgi:hypothetical protein
VAATVTQSLLHTERVAGDVRIIDATDPTQPVELADWDLRRDGDLAAIDPTVGDSIEHHAHSLALSEDGTRLRVAHWDGGIVTLDLDDPANPLFVSRIGDIGSEGNTHSVAFDSVTGLLASGREDFYPTEVEDHMAGWGGLRFFDGNGAAVGSFDTEHSVGESALDGFYTAHEVVLEHGLAYASWYSDGVRIVDLADPTEPTEVGYFVPPGAADPQGYWVAPDGSQAFPMVWGIDVVDNLIYLSDMHTGLWIVRFSNPTSEYPEVTAPDAR